MIPEDSSGQAGESLAGIAAFAERAANRPLGGTCGRVVLLVGDEDPYPSPKALAYGMKVSGTHSHGLNRAMSRDEGSVGGAKPYYAPPVIVRASWVFDVLSMWPIPPIAAYMVRKPM
jgi:hypothetical protein